MPAMRRLACVTAWLVCLPAALAGVTTAAFVPVAHSALVTLEAARTSSGVRLRALRSSDRAPLAATAITVSIDGRSAPVTPAPDGTWNVGWPPADSSGGQSLEVVLAHDGIRELLSGPLPAALAAPPAAGGLMGSHKQMIWWVLNIAIVLIAVLAVSRRTS
jgi:hypothetical protein